MESKKCFFLTGIFSVMCFFGISYVIHTSFVKEKDLFRDYIEKFNKTYDENDREYFRRFENFKVSIKLLHKF